MRVYQCVTQIITAINLVLGIHIFSHYILIVFKCRDLLTNITMPLMPIYDIFPRLTGTVVMC